MPAALLSMLGSLGSSILGGIGSMVTKAVGGVLSMIASIPGRLISMVGTIGSSLQSAAGLLAEGVSSFVSFLQSSVQSLIKFSQSVTSIANRTGATREQSLALTNQFQALGISSDETAQMFSSMKMNPELFNARATSVGAPTLDGSPDSMVQMARWYQSEKAGGVGNQMAADAKLKAMFGPISDGMLRMLNTNPEKLQKEIDYKKDTDSKLGLTPDVITKASDEFPLLMNRIMTFIESVKMRFAADLLPTLEAIFGGISDVFAANAGGISEAIRGFATWMYVEMPDMALNAMSVMIDTGHAIANTFFNIVDAAAVMMQAFDGKSGALYTVISSVAGFIDSILNLMTDFAAGFAVAQTLVSNAIAASPLLSGAAKLMGFEFETRNPMEAAAEVYNERGRSNIKGEVDKFAESGVVGGAGKRVAEMSKKGRAISDDVAKTAHGVVKTIEKSIGPKSDRQDKMANLMKEGTAKQIEAINKNGDKVAGAVMTQGQQASAAAMGSIGASLALRARRRSGG